MPRKVNQIYNLKLPDNRLDKHLETRYYLALQGTSQRKKAGAASSNNYGTMERHHSWIS